MKVIGQCVVSDRDLPCAILIRQLDTVRRYGQSLSARIATVCCHSSCMLCPSVVRQCPMVNRGPHKHDHAWFQQRTHCQTAHWTWLNEQNEGSDPLSDSVPRSDQLPRETSGANQRNRVSFDFIGPLHWFPVATDRIVVLSPKVDRW